MFPTIVLFIRKDTAHRHNNVLQHMRSSLRLSLATTHDDGNEEVSRIIDNIATIHNSTELSEGLCRRCNTNSSNSDLEARKKTDASVVSQESSICTDETVNRISMQDDFICFDGGDDDGDGEDAETMFVTGHYNPKKVTIDIKKVHPTILHSGKNIASTPKIYEKQLSKIEERLEAQEDMMRRILSKMEDRSNTNDGDDS